MSIAEQIISICKQRLDKRYETIAMHYDCKIAIIVPVFNESVETIARLIDSLGGQQTVGSNNFEVFLVVNNDLPGTKDYADIYAANQKILRHAWTKNVQFAIHAVDCSSKGREISQCTVGAARDIGLHLAALGFGKNNVNGALLHVDADTHFKDRFFLKKVLTLFEDPNVIGAAGGKNREVELSDYSIAAYPNRKALAHAFRMQATAGRCKYLLKFIEGDSFLYRVFTGTNMIGRAFESILVGGIPHINYLEDWQYGFRLWEYALQHQQHIVVDRSLRVSASFRISERTGSSFKNAIHDLIDGKAPTAKHPTTGKLLTLDEETYAKLRQEALALPNGQSIVAYMDDYDITIQ